MCDKMLNYILFFMFLLSRANSIAGEEVISEAIIEDTTAEDIESSSMVSTTVESNSETTEDSSLSSTMESSTETTTLSSLELTTIASETEENTTTSSSTESVEDATSSQEPSAEPEPTTEAEPETTAEAEPTSELEPSSAKTSTKVELTSKLESMHSSASNISSKLEPIKKMAEMNETQPDQKAEDKCSCQVAGVLTSIVEVLKELNNEVQAMKTQMIVKCPGFGSGNDTDDSGDKVPESLEMANTTESATGLEDASDGPTTTPLPPIPTECDAPFQPVASSCYYFLYYPQDWKSWGEANAYCQTLGGTLAAPHRFGDLREYLINNFSNVFWIGAKKALKGSSYEWLTGKTFKEENWKDGEPSKAAAKFCLYVESFSGYKAVNYYCGEKFSFVCEKRESGDDATAKDS